MREVRSSEPTRRKVDAPTAGVTRMIITCAEAGTPTHEAFLRNVLAYANWLNAELMVVKIGDGDVDPVVIDFLWTSPVDLEDQVEVATNVSVHPRATRPLGSVKGCRSAVWTVVPHAVIQLETMPRIRADGLRVQLTTGAMTLPHRSAIPGSREELGAVIVELSSDGVGHCRHILAPVDGDGSFQDLAVRVEGGSIKRGCGVEAINYGDIHHSSLDAEVAAATWGISEFATATLANSAITCAIAFSGSRCQTFWPRLDGRRRSSAEPARTCRRPAGPRSRPPARSAS